MRVSGKVFLSVLLVAASVVSILQVQPASAAQITARSLTLQAGATDGGSKPGGVVNHLFTFNLPNTPTLGSIKFEYCTTASGTCTAPVGLTNQGPPATTLGASTGAIFTNITNDVSGNVSYVSRTAASYGGGTVTVRLDGVKNPTAATATTFFARISTYASEDTTGSPIDSGTVAASTATAIELTGTMPESLIFCTGADITAPGGIPNCSTATPGTIAFNQLFSPTDTATAISKMAASTNATNGYAITVAGATLTSGSNTIPALGATATVPTRGLSQFGLNLATNTTAVSTPAVGAAITPTSNTTDLRAKAAANFDTADSFAFVANTSNVVARSDDGGTLGPTNAQIYTVSYIVNVAGSQTAGTYNTTLTYVCTPTF